MVKTKTREITIKGNKSGFSFFGKSKDSKDNYDFSGMSALRQLLNNEKARVLHVIKQKSPKSIYELAKILDRDFKAVRDDIKLLERFGFIEMIEEKTKNRKRHRPAVVVDAINIQVKL